MLPLTMKKLTPMFIILFLLSCSSSEKALPVTSKPMPIETHETTEDMPDETSSEMKSEFAPSKLMEMEHMPRADRADKVSVPSQSGLKAGFADDNQAYNAYLEFLEKYKDVPQIKFTVQERIVIKVVDSKNNPLPDALLEFRNSGKLLGEAKTLANGETLFFPSEYPQDSYDVIVKYAEKSEKFTVKRNGLREQTFKLPTEREPLNKLPVDVLFILDTTGSMGNEIARIKNTMLIIHQNLQLIDPSVDIRFGMVMYKDRGDVYITRNIPFTSNVEAFQKEVAKINANGGGDTPEDMQSALKAATEMNWRNNGVRLSYTITDAPAHIDYGQTFTLLSSAQAARAKGIKMHSVGTGGLPIEGELNLRQVAQYTQGKYIFLTYGEKGDSEGGAPGSVSHHVGGNFTTDKLETIIIRFTKDEISEYLQKPLDRDEDYFEASQGEDSTKVLQELFNGMVISLVNYSGMAINKDTPVAVIPLGGDCTLKANTEYFTEQLYFAATKYKGFKHVERKDLQKILTEIKFNTTGLVTDESALQLGKLIGAKLLITGSLFYKDNGFEVYLKLIRTESGESLSVTMGKANKALGQPITRNDCP